MKKALFISFAIISLPAAGYAKETSPPPELDKWVNCIVHKSFDYSKMDAAIETAAKGVMGACKAQELDYFETLTKVSFADAMLEGKFAAKARKRQQAEELRQGMREDFQEHTISLIMELRSHPTELNATDQASIDTLLQSKKAEFQKSF